MDFIRIQRRIRALLLLSTAGLGLAAAPALARDAAPAGPLDASAAERTPHGTGTRIVSAEEVERAAQIRAGLIQPVAPEPDVLVSPPRTPGNSVDPTNITGIGQMIIDQGDGFVGLCTGTLINPRTVIFAAHCVNGEAATAYGAESGGRPIGFGFEASTRANAPGEVDELLRWLGFDSTDPTGSGMYKTNVAQSFYNVNHVAYNPLSLEPDAQSFLYGDVAIATLDTPAAHIPTWALLFSPLPATEVTAAGTGYNVGISGYGNTGTGVSGVVGSDFRRRSAENILGALTDLETFEGFLFGGAPNGLTQNLYFLDFDDPRRGMATASPFDFNAFRDNARVTNGTPTEGLTSQGDSGGPLILQNFAKQVVIGVLSGGYDRFFTGQPHAGFGTVGFYQPLYLYWDWVVENNPYRYVASVAGNGAWSDPNHWVTTLDPAYMILSNGQLVNGLPTDPGEQANGTDGDFGQICFESGGISDCYDTATGVETVRAAPIGTAGNNAGSALVGDGAAQFDGVERTAQADGVAALPSPTLANGLPGATGFVPNNVDPVRETGAAGRYYDVTLAATGTTTLSSAATIDRLTIATSGAQLNVASGGALTSLMGVNQLAGFVTVNGTLTSGGDYSLFGGGILGSGRINAPFVTSVLGQFAPGTTSTIGTLTIGGNLVMSTGTTYFVNLTNGQSDRIATVAANGAQGLANVGGQLALSFTSALNGSQSYTILTSEGGITGTFADPGTISAILSPALRYTANAVFLDITVGSYANIVSPSDPAAFAYARVLDANRSRATSYEALYGALDLQDAATIRATLNGFTPAGEATVQTLGMATVDSNSNFVRTRLQRLDPANLGGTLAHYGRPVQVASLGLSPVGGNTVASDMAAPTMLQEGALPDDMSGFIAGGYLNGDGRAMAGVGGRDDFDGWYVGGGIEVAAGDNALVGFALTYTNLDGTPSFPGQTVKSEAFQGTLYGKMATAGGLTVDGQVTAGALTTRNSRTVGFLGTDYTLRASDTALVIASELGIAKDFGGDAIEIAPRIAARATHIGFGSAIESGGPMALDVRREAFTSYQGRAGLTLGAKSATVRPFVTGTYVHEFADQPGFVMANLVGGAGGGVPFVLNGEDKDWAEISGGLTFRTGAVDLSIAADTTLARSDLSVQTYRGSVTFRF